MRNDIESIIKNEVSFGLFIQLNISCKNFLLKVKRLVFMKATTCQSTRLLSTVTVNQFASE